MIRVTRVAEDGTETAVVEIDDFTVEVLYSGIADLLRDAASSSTTVGAAASELPLQARQRRARILARIGA